MTAMDRAAIETKVKKEVFAPLMPGRQAVALDEDLLGILDSLQILRLTVGIESAFGIKIDNSELTADNVGTLGRLTEFISTKIGRRH